MIKEIRINIKILKESGEVEKHNWKITGFLHRKLKVMSNNQIHIRTATEIRNYFMKLLQSTASSPLSGMLERREKNEN